MKAIFVDDEEYIRSCIRTLIHWQQIDIQLVGVCANYFEAISVIEDEQPDIIITDIKMPVLTGLDLIEKSIALGFNGEFIVLSGYNEFSYAQTAMKFGVKQYILKPFNEENIVSALQTCKQQLLEKRNKPAALINQLSEKIHEEFAQNDKNTIENALQQLLRQESSQEIITAAFSKIIMHYTELKAIRAEECSEILQKIFHCNSYQQVNEVILSYCTNLIQGMPDSKNCIDKICQYIENNYHEDFLSLAWVASNIVYMNADYLGKLFYKTTGYKFSKYLTNKRIEKAKYLLRTQSSLKIYQIAESVGFGNNPTYFNQVFKEVTQMTPLNYAEKQRSEI